MIIIDIWVASYFSLFKKYEQKGLCGTFIIFFGAWIFNIFTILNHIIPSLFDKGSINFFCLFILLMIISMILSWWATNVLEKRYLDKWDYFFKLSNKIPRIIGILIMIVHYIASIWYFSMSLRNYVHLIR